MKATKIALIISSLGPGGAERVVANLANGLVARGHTVLVATYRHDKPDFYRLDPRVTRAWFRFDVPGRQKIANLRACLEAFDPDRVISHINKTNVRCLLAGWGARWQTLVTEHNDPRMQPIEIHWDWARHWLYRRAQWVVGVSQGVVDYFPLVPKSRKIVVPNGVPDHGCRRSGPRSHRILAVGRLVPIKGFDRLIEAFAGLGSAAEDWTLEIWGEGDERARLQADIDRRGLGRRVFLKGLTVDPFLEMAGADMLVCSSHSEGFGNVLVEAMSVGLPVVSFDCPTGPREIIENEVNGILVPDRDVGALTVALDRLILDEELWRRLAEGALRSVEARFAEAVVLDQWEALLQ